MIRLVDASAVVREAFPEAYADLAVAVTTLGSPSVLLFVLATLYWLSPRRRAVAFVIASAVAGAAVVLAVKALVGLPRPPSELFLVEADGYGYPSGHAFAATVVYGGLAAAYDLHRRPAGVAAVAAPVVLVALSRVVLGVHYLGDVVASVALGIAFLAAMGRVADGDPKRAFAVGVACAAAALVVAGPGDDLALATGGAVGGFVASGRIEGLADPRSRLERVALVAVGYVLVAAGLAAEAALESVADATAASETPAFVAVYAALVAAILLAPAVGGRIASPRFRRT